MKYIYFPDDAYLHCARNLFRHNAASTDMDSSTFAAIHKYWAVLSVVGTAIAVLAYIAGGPIGTTALLFFGWAGPLGVFYFGGAHLVHTNSYASAYHTVSEELMRGVAWYSVSFSW